MLKTLARHPAKPAAGKRHLNNMTPNIDIPDKERAAVVEILNRLLADEYVLYTKTRNYH